MAKAPKEIKELKIEKIESKEHKDFKFEKVEKNEAKEHKDHKIEKLEKNEFKEHKDAKIEKLEKNEAKEHKDHKNEKIEHKEFAKDLGKIEHKELQEVDKRLGKEKDGKELVEGNPGDLGDPAIHQGVGAAGQGTAAHFIDPEKRPDLSGGALSGEEDRG
ncbi:MAG: hypothetical protein JWO81_1747 [Alphaproteobacteria bacterium]|nr:hypothetical protein [Alphaproteobacteria bacterium]